VARTKLNVATVADKRNNRASARLAIVGRIGGKGTQERYKKKEWLSIEGFVKGEKAAADDERIFASLTGTTYIIEEGLPSASVAKQTCC
jgi:hypothetical protein